MPRSRVFRWRSLLNITIFILLVIILTVIILLFVIRPPRTNTNLSLFPGILYERIVLSQPRLLMVHIVTIDLNIPGIKPLVTPRFLTSPDNKIRARTTSEFVNKFNLQIAINGNFFYPFIEKKPWNFYPKSGELVNVVGRAISNGNDYSKIKSQRNLPA